MVSFNLKAQALSALFLIFLEALAGVANLQVPHSLLNLDSQVALDLQIQYTGAKQGIAVYATVLHPSMCGDALSTVY